MARNDGVDRTFVRNQDLPTLNDVAKAQEHNEREKENYSNQDIDTSQTCRNIPLQNADRQLFRYVRSDDCRWHHLDSWPESRRSEIWRTDF